MHRNRSLAAARKLFYVVAMMVLLLSTFRAGGVPAVRAQELPPGSPTPLAPKTPPPGMEAFVTGLSVSATADSYEVDDTVLDLEAGLTAGTAQLLVSGTPQAHSISPAADKDYVKFHLSQTSSITLVTSGMNPLEDTEMWLYNSSLLPLDYNDDQSPTQWHSYIQRCGPTALPAGDYYAMVDKRQNDAEIASYNITLTINSSGPDTCVPNTRVLINNMTRGVYWVHPEDSTRPSFAGLNSGPVRVGTLDGVKPVIASMGVFLKKTAGYESYNEVIGVPGSRVTNMVWFPWYENASAGSLVSQLCFANVGGANTSVSVTIGGVARGNYGLPVNRARCVSYLNLSAGPVRVRSSAAPIVASLSSQMKKNVSYASYAEFAGLSPSDTLSTDFMFPGYYNASAGPTVSQIRFTNIGGRSTTVTITVRGVAQPLRYTLIPNQTQLMALSNMNNGPVHVQSSGGVPITASMIVKLKSSANYTGYSELIGLPLESPAETRFVFPWYNNSTTGMLASQIRVTNLSNLSNTNVTVTIGGTTMPGVVSLLPRQSKLVAYPNINKGPVVLQSSGGVPILASMITYLKKGYAYTSYSEFIGQLAYPGNQLAPSAWFPWYNNLGAGPLVSHLRFALPAKP